MKNITVITLLVLVFVLAILASTPTELTYDMADYLEARQVEFATARNLAWEEGIMDQKTEEYPTTNTPTEFIMKWGKFTEKRMPTRGRAVVYKDKVDIYMTVEYFETGHFADLKLYLIPSSDTNSVEKVKDSFYEVGRINYEGDQVFDLPDDMDMEKYNAAVIFSEHQDMIYGLATLS